MEKLCCKLMPAKERKLQLLDGQPRIKVPGLAEKVWKQQLARHKEMQHSK